MADQQGSSLDAFLSDWEWEKIAVWARANAEKVLAPRWNAVPSKVIRRGSDRVAPNVIAFAIRKAKEKLAAATTQTEGVQ